MNQIVRGARDNNTFEVPTPGLQNRSSSMAAKGQLTPLKNDSHERIKFMQSSVPDERKRKIERLDPIQLGESNKRI